MEKNFEFWNVFEKSGKLSDYLNFKGIGNGQGTKDTGTDNKNQ